MKKENTVWKLALITIAVGAAVALLFIFSIQSTQNKAFSLEEKVETATSDIEVQEKRRVDLIYNMADCVMQYDKHESETLKAVVDGRANKSNIENVSTMIRTMTEAYPELKSDSNYKELMKELAITENMISESRRNYNTQIEHYNRYVKRFPNRTFLEILGYEKKEYKRLNYNAPETAPQNLFGDR